MLNVIAFSLAPAAAIATSTIDNRATRCIGILASTPGGARRVGRGGVGGGGESGGEGDTPGKASR